ncbi:translation initiation factor IF-2 [Spizellomyces punctatus DAOM BR117]|uniref:Translation initiation factor IF-2, mitochondrial n=1 Tax=Spizellomyces punctatus (strain DAOM BR117) TaxID=645134 RepID=A0A0L0HUS9_SPIPD|nr:translation initiation factor IF-2 [Spizellomyces punctatus DAOM BR117]KND05091.1 translation initiation factor IF-2 [Spizellomyces punctatus DAOM BR117]|eukprot:XP_016613130.1 translation initiation factor IF-2 [Spizellomyces punctatus DAOM BR117]
MSHSSTVLSRRILSRTTVNKCYLFRHSTLCPHYLSTTARVDAAKQTFGGKPSKSSFHKDGRDWESSGAAGGQLGKKGKSKDKDRDRERRERDFLRKEPERHGRPTTVRPIKPKAPPKPKDIHLQEGISVSNLSTLLGVSYQKLARQMKRLGLEDTGADFVLNSEMASLIVLEYGMNPVVAALPDLDLKPRPPPEDWSDFPVRPPVVTIMGHVDHGKTTLLDALRKTSVAAGEAGGITQHIGAFSVLLPSKKRITFLDTPGHAAFSAMRARGAQTTDIVVLVVAADDGVMPQTVEAIKHALTAQVPIIVAINKCDKPHINLRKVKEGLLRHEIVLEEYGGEIPAVQISALTGKGLDELEENILTLAEVMDIRGDPSGPVEGVVVESKLVRGRGNVATVLVKRGTLKPGGVVVAGTTWCKVRVMHDEHGVAVKEAGPSLPVEVMGWKELPAAGDEVLGADKEDLAKKVVESRVERTRRLKAIEGIDQLNAARQKEKQVREGKVDAATPDDTSTIPTQNIILKADVHGSLEALVDAIHGLPAHEVRIKIVGSGVGPVTESDIDSASATGATIISFNLPTDKRTHSYASSKKVQLVSHQIIYKLLDDLKDMLSDLLPPEMVTEVHGEAEIAQIFRINVKGKVTEAVAGCRIITGKMQRSHKVRVVRAGEIVYDGTLKTFKHHKKDIQEASKGLECGMGFEGFDKFEEGDIIQGYTIVEKKRRIS